MNRDHASDKDVRLAGQKARAIVKHHLGSPPRRVQELGGGRTNFVYAVVHRDGDFVVRLSFEPSKIKDYFKELEGG